MFGAFHPGPDDGAPADTGTLILLGPSEPGFWPHLTGQPEWRNADPDPFDRWSRRVIGQIACDLGAKALFPFAGPPWQPFIAWAKRSGRAWESPVGFLVHDQAGLMVSYRGALALKSRLDLPAPPAEAPCAICDRPCLAACPVGALSANGYDAASCHGFLDTEDGKDCMETGCAVRRACPVSRTYGRLPCQSAYHMRRFHP
ncbi:ferredoxin [Roseibacterium sp. SDUM158016]|nr:ferredoxin [Roseibacterium sp. SDUM158016]MCU4654089.1 ferredoxin [Roseibacterium sp. SDUM158016]